MFNKAKNELVINRVYTFQHEVYVTRGQFKGIQKSDVLVTFLGTIERRIDGKNVKCVQFRDNAQNKVYTGTTVADAQKLMTQCRSFPLPDGTVWGGLTTR